MGFEFVGGDEAGDAAAENGYFDAFAEGGVEIERLLCAESDGRDPERLHGEEGCAVAAGLADTCEELTTGESHGSPRWGGVYCAIGRGKAKCEDSSLRSDDMVVWVSPAVDASQWHRCTLARVALNTLRCSR
jgi:hypothetical protein